MSTFGISGSGFSQLDNLLASTQQFNSGFQQLGSDLTSGNLAAAQEDFVTLSQDALSSPFAQGSASSSTAASTSSATASTAAESTVAASASSSPATTSTGNGTQSALAALAQDFQTLGQDLQSGNLAGAQQAFSQIQQAAQQGAQQGAQSEGGHARHHHHHGSSSSGSDSGSSGSAASELQSLLSSISSAASSSPASTASSATGSSTSSASATSSAASSAASSTTSAAASGSNSAGPLSAIEADFQGLGTALQSGNLAGAQQAFMQLTQDAQSLSGAQHRHPAQSNGVRSSAELMQALLSSQPTGSAASSSTAASPSPAVSSLNVSA